MKVPSGRALAAAAIVLGGLAPFAGAPYRVPAAGIDAVALARAVAREDDHVTAIELAEWIRDRKPSLRIIDIRDKAAFDAYHVPNAERRSLEDVVAERFRPGDTTVLYSQGGTHAAQAWVLLRASGHARVYFLRGGVEEWLEDVMSPAIAADAPAAERQSFARIAELSRYFGGTPRELAPNEHARETARDTAAAILARRHGC